MAEDSPLTAEKVPLEGPLLAEIDMDVCRVHACSGLDFFFGTRAVLAADGGTLRMSVLRTGNYVYVNNDQREERKCVIPKQDEACLEVCTESRQHGSRGRIRVSFLPNARLSLSLLLRFQSLVSYQIGFIKSLHKVGGVVSLCPHFQDRMRKFLKARALWMAEVEQSVIAGDCFQGTRPHRNVSIKCHPDTVLFCVLQPDEACAAVL